MAFVLFARAGYETYMRRDANDMEHAKGNKAASHAAGTLERKAVPAEAGMRLDQYWAREMAERGASRERVKEWLQAGLARVDGVVVKKPGYRLEGFERVSLDAPDFSTEITAAPEPGELTVLHRDETLAVVVKPAGLTTHPAPTQPAGTLVNRLLHHFPELAPEVSAMHGERPGIVHRLDKDTSGLMLVALTEAARLALSQAFADRRVHKTYLALVHGRPKGDEAGPLGEDAGFIDLPMGRHPTLRTKMTVLRKGGREARTGWRRLWTDRLGRASLLAVDLHTGRTHQIRVHLAHLGHPLLGDPVYGPSQHARWLAEKGPLAQLATRQMLHAFRLAFEHPGRAEELVFRQDPPEDFMALLRALGTDCQRVVLTGAPLCGKSALLAALEAMPEGPPTFSADACVARLYAPGGDGAALLSRSLGRGVLGADGGVDKAGLLSLLRKTPGLRREVEDIVHPLVRHALDRFWAANAHAPLAVAEIPLYFEAGWQGRKGGEARRMADVVVGVRCPDDLRRGPLREGRALPSETLDALDSWQWPQERKLAACDMVVENAGTLAALEAQAGPLLKRLAALRGEREAAFAARMAALLDQTAEKGADVPCPGLPAAQADDEDWWDEADG